MDLTKSSLSERDIVRDGGGSKGRKKIEKNRSRPQNGATTGARSDFLRITPLFPPTSVPCPSPHPDYLWSPHTVDTYSLLIHATSLSVHFANLRVLSMSLLGFLRGSEFDCPLTPYSKFLFKNPTFDLMPVSHVKPPIYA